ncbi:MAG: hypothetical protein LQ345_000787 [Seirophora villosa]|nr:MAG: hypothetical protein LQ345_000787 [Seirophora villosa]
MAVEKRYLADRLDWIMLQVLGPPERKGRYDHAMLFALLEDRLAKSPAAERARLDQTLYDKLSDLAAMHELLVAVRLHRPMNADWSPDDLKKTEHRRLWRMGEDAPSGRDKEQKDQNYSLDFIGKRVKAFMEIPPPTGKQDLAWLAQSEKATEALKTLWTSICAHKDATLRPEGISADDIERTLGSLRADSSPEYIAAVQESRERILSKPEPAAVTPTGVPAQTTWESKHSPEIPNLPIREQPKTKTRPEQPAITQAKEETTDTQSSEATTNTTASPPLRESRSIALTQRTINILSNLFPADKESGAKIIDWNAFVQAMGDAKFVARHSGGSAVTFENQGSSGGKIVFHKPHPVAKISPVMSRCIGRTMSKWFGWSKDTFCLVS